MLTQYPKLGEPLYRFRLENGLQVLVNPRPGFTKTLAYFATAYYDNFHKKVPLCCIFSPF